jgi:predicted dehydrogenase
LRKKVKIAMAGLAHAHGTGFLKSALKHEGVSIVGFYDNDNPENAKAASEEFGAPVFTDLDELLYNQGANTLLTARINNVKPEYIIRALKAGLGVIADKPMATTMEDIDKIEAAANESGAPLYLMLTERFDAAVYTAKQMIDRGEIGKITSQYLVRPHRLRPERRPAWMFDRKQYGGIINDIGVHDIDLARFFTGSEVKQVLGAKVSNMRFTEYTDFCDNGTALFEMEDGSVATVTVHWMTPDAYHAHGDTRFLLEGTHGFLTISTVEQTVRFSNDTHPIGFAEIVQPPLSCAEDALATMADPEHKPVITTQDSINSTRAVLIAQKLAEEGR